LNNLVSATDGVGGWANSGVDPAIFAKKLNSNIRIRGQHADNDQIKNPKAILADAVEATTDVGTATCICISLDFDEAKIYSALIGDCGYILLRKQPTDLHSIYRSKD
jgi:serine/threonine protein phosphatase PrpC